MTAAWSDPGQGALARDCAGADTALVLTAPCRAPRDSHGGAGCCCREHFTCRSLGCDTDRRGTCQGTCAPGLAACQQNVPAGLALALCGGRRARELTGGIHGCELRSLGKRKQGIISFRTGFGGVDCSGATCSKKKDFGFSEVQVALTSPLGARPSV